MPTRRFILSLALAGLSTLALTGCDNKPAAGAATGGETKAAARVTLAIIPKDQNHAFWKAVKRGVDKAEAETNTKIIWRATQKGDDSSGQVDIINSVGSDSMVKGVAVAPITDKSPVQAINDLRAKGLPVIIFDSPLDAKIGETYASFVGTDNKVAGHAGGVALAKVMGDNKKTVLLRYKPGSASTDAREEGFLAAAKENNLTLISDNQYAGVDQSSAKDKATSMMDKIVEAGGVFAPNESASLGLYNALLDAKASGKIKAGQIKMVAFDATPLLVQGLLDGDIAAIVVQDPEVMGYKTVKTLLAAVKGEKVPESVDSGYQVVTKDNLKDANIRAILLAYSPDIAKLLPAAK